MKEKTFKTFILEPNSRVTFIDKTKNEMWENWKDFKDCTDEEKEKINLASYPSNTILFDRDLKGWKDEQINDDYFKFSKGLKQRGIHYFYSYRSPQGYHIIAPFKNLDIYNDDLRKELRKYYVSLFESDPAKISDRGVVSLPDRPHFKNGEIYTIKEHFVGINEFKESVVNTCKERIEKNKKITQDLLKDKDFTNYFKEDPFFNYIKKNIIPDNTNRDFTIFPNLAIASVKSGKSKEEIDNILKPIIKNNFPGKRYAEFEGWYKKAVRGAIDDYNPVQLNNWMKDFSETKMEIYDLKGMTSKESLGIVDVESEEFKIYWDDELDTIENIEIEWLVEDWLPRGDICFVAGKASSYKSSICLHFAYAMANGKLVFNKYNTKKNKVLYLNEENSNSIVVQAVKRIKKGLDLEDGGKNVAFSLLNRFKFDKIEDINRLIEFVNKNEIRVLIFDSFRRFFLGEENDANVINKIFNLLKFIRSKTNTTIIVIHHNKKNTNRGDNDVRDRMRGSSDIIAGVDSAMEVNRATGALCFKIRHSKLRAALEQPDKLIAIEPGDASYMYEIDDTKDKEKNQTNVENIADLIINKLDEEKTEYIKPKQIRAWVSDKPYDNVTKAIKKLVDEDLLLIINTSRVNREYKYNKLVIPKRELKKTDDPDQTIL